MPANLNDTAATKHQNDRYLTDATHSEGKPYSRKQREHMESIQGLTMLYNREHPTNGVKISHADAVVAMDAGWVDAPLIHPNNPNPIVVKKDVGQMLKDAKKLAEENEKLIAELEKEAGVVSRHDLMTQAKSLGLNPHHKLSTESLIKLIEGAPDG